VFLYHGGAISWSSKRQTTVSCSTAEAEYIPAAAATCEALSLKKLMVDLDEADRAVPMAKEIFACLAFIANPEKTGRAKHIDSAHHVVRERAAMGAVKFFHQAGAETAADGLTKALAGPALAYFRRRLEMVELREPRAPPTTKKTSPIAPVGDIQLDGHARRTMDRPATPTVRLCAWECDRGGVSASMFSGHARGTCVSGTSKRP